MSTSKIKIYARVRLNEEQNCKNPSYLVTSREHNIQIKKEKKNLVNEIIIEKKNYIFDKVFDIDYKNQDIYNEIGFQMLNNFLNNRNCVFYVYGQTGSGKTYSLFGDDEDIGIFEMLLLDFAAHEMKIKYNGVQIYNNQCYDILNKKVLKECELHDGSVEFLNIESKELDFSNMDCHEIINNVRNIILDIKHTRHVGISSSNNSSSRSHLILQLFNGDKFIKIIDLAGSERATRSLDNNEHNFRENAEINLGILAIKECIRNINKSKIPYRNSKITKILKSTFTNEVYTYILSTISPLAKDIVDTCDTLLYISSFKKIMKHKPLKPIDDKVKESLNKLNKDINKELGQHCLKKTKLLGLIEQNINSLKDLKSNLNNL